MIKKITLFIALALISEILTACFLLNSENCGYSKLRIFRYVGLSLDNVNTSSGRPYPVKENTPGKSYGIRLIFDLETIAAHNSIKLSWFNVAYAQCIDETLKPQDTISSIKIITKSKFDDRHDAGSDISDYFDYYDVYDHFGIPIESLIIRDSNYSDYFDWEYDFLSNERTIDLRLRDLPSRDTVFSFTVNVKLTSGDSLTSTTEPIMLQ